MISSPASEELTGAIEADTVCPISSDPIYIVSYYIKLVTTYCTYSKTKVKHRDKFHDGIVY